MFVQNKNLNATAFNYYTKIKALLRDTFCNLECVN